MSLIQIRGVTKEYQDGKTTVHALRGVDLDVHRGEFMAVAGPSGSGKTTLLNVIGGLDTVTAGGVRVGGLDVSTMKPGDLTRLRRERIGFVFQAYNLIPVLTASENVEFVMMLQGAPAWDRRQRAEEILKRVGLESEMHRRPSALSGGQQQRVAVARAIVSRPSVVLADEPTANLDSETGALLLDLMKHLNSEDGTTFLFSTHDPMVMAYARRVVRLQDGRIAADNSREEVGDAQPSLPDEAGEASREGDDEREGARDESPDRSPNKPAAASGGDRVSVADSDEPFDDNLWTL